MLNWGMEVFMVTFRTILAFAGLLLLMRLLKKKQLSQFTLYDYVVGITIGSMASTLTVELENRTLTVFWGMILWAILPLMLGWLYLKSMPLRRALDREPKVVIDQGRILEDRLRKEHVNLEDLHMQLRSAGVFDPADVEYGVLEKNGQLNVLKKKEKQVVTLGDLGLETASPGMPLILIMDGAVLEKALARSPYSRDWLQKELQKQGIEDLSAVFLAQVDGQGNLHVDRRTEPHPQLKILEEVKKTIQRLEEKLH